MWSTDVSGRLITNIKSRYRSLQLNFQLDGLFYENIVQNDLPKYSRFLRVRPNVFQRLKACYGMSVNMCRARGCTFHIGMLRVIVVFLGVYKRK